MKFNEVIGQEDVWARLMNMAQEERIPHALLFCGPKGCGKMAVALAFASYLMGENMDTDDVSQLTDAERRTSAMLKKWEHPDLHFT